jgi:hypothetical protein
MHFSTNVILTQAGADWLDEQALMMRKKNRVPMTRSAFLRAFVKAIQTFGPDFSQCRSEQDVAGHLLFLLVTVRDGRGAALEALRAMMTSGEQNGRPRP